MPCAAGLTAGARVGGPARARRTVQACGGGRRGCSASTRAAAPADVRGQKSTARKVKRYTDTTPSPPHRLLDVWERGSVCDTAAALRWSASAPVKFTGRAECSTRGSGSAGASASSLKSAKVRRTPRPVPRVDNSREPHIGSVLLFFSADHRDE